MENMLKLIYPDEFAVWIVRITTFPTTFCPKVAKSFSEGGRAIIIIVLVFFPHALFSLVLSLFTKQNNKGEISVKTFPW